MLGIHLGGWVIKVKFDLVITIYILSRIPSDLGINSKFLSLEFKLLLRQQQPLLLLCSWRELYPAIQTPFLMLFLHSDAQVLLNCLLCSVPGCLCGAWLSFGYTEVICSESLGLCYKHRSLGLCYKLGSLMVFCCSYCLTFPLQLPGL